MKISSSHLNIVDSSAFAIAATVLLSNSFAVASQLANSDASAMPQFANIARALGGFSIGAGTYFLGKAIYLRNDLRTSMLMKFLPTGLLVNGIIMLLVASVFDNQSNWTRAIWSDAFNSSVGWGNANAGQPSNLATVVSQTGPQNAANLIYGGCTVLIVFVLALVAIIVSEARGLYATRPLNYDVPNAPEWLSNYKRNNEVSSNSAPEAPSFSAPEAPSFSAIPAAP